MWRMNQCSSTAQHRVHTSSSNKNHILSSSPASNGGDSTSESTMPSSPEVVSPLQQAHLTPFHGLSALIEAATAQLGHLADVACSTLKDKSEEDGEQNGEVLYGADTDEKDDGTSRDGPRGVVLGISEDQDLDGLLSANFPQRLLMLCLEPKNSDSIAFLPDGKFFAIRKSNFRLLLPLFAGMVSFSDFLLLIDRWGFSRIGGGGTTGDGSTEADPSKVDDSTGIFVFRHPNFVANDKSRCRLIRYGEFPEHVRMHALPSHNRINVGVLSDVLLNKSDSIGPCPISQAKRRLSPGVLNRKESSTSISSRQRVEEADHRHHERSFSLGGVTSHTPELMTRSKRRQRHSLPHAPLLSVSDDESNDQARSMALSITAERLKLTHKHLNKNSVSSKPTLVERAVTSCTHDIVTDAIESLLRDAGHSKQMYLKHEKELSKSSLPGVIPVCKHIFAPTTIASVVTVDTASAVPKLVKEMPSRVVTTSSETLDSDKTAQSSIKAIIGGRKVKPIDESEYSATKEAV